MNIHHLELFYFVARHGGISQAVRQMPYGIQQPAVSSQIIQLEESLGVTLFHRRPFALTPQGEKLYQFIKPFFEHLGPMADKLRGGGQYQHLRLGASELVLRDHLPVPLQNVKRKFPALKVTLRSGYQPELQAWLAGQEVDLAVTLLDARPPVGMKSLALLKIPLALLVPASSLLRAADELWRRDRIEEPLIALPTDEPIYKNFQQGLQKLGVDWFPGIEVASLDLIEAYVANGYGLGVGVQVPKAPAYARVRVLPLPDFPPVTLGALWRGKLTPVMRALLDELQQRAKALAP